MRLSIVTAFPDLIRQYLGCSVLGRGVASGKLDVRVVDLRDHSQGDYRQVDDYSFGGGGMVLMAEPLARAVESLSGEGKPFVVYPSPQGVPLHQELVEDLSRVDHVVLVCGHYEGVDERFVRRFVDLEVSLGDFVLTGGELPAMALVDALARLVPGVVGRGEAVVNDSFYRGFLDHPHFTRPAAWRDDVVPEVLAGGDHGAIEDWRRREGVRRTLARRPDVLARAGLLPYLKHGIYVLQVHHPVRDERGEATVASVAAGELRNMTRTCRTYGVRRFLVADPLPAQRDLVKRLQVHGAQGDGAAKDRGEALGLLKLFPRISRAAAWVREKEKADPLLVATSARPLQGAQHWLGLKRRFLEEDRPVVLVFGAGGGLHDEALRDCEGMLLPVRGGSPDGYNHLSGVGAVAVVLDRFLGWR